MSRRVSWGTLAVVVVIALAIGATGGGDARTDADRVVAIASEVRCPTCRGLSVAESDAKASEAIRADIRERVKRGESDDAIRAYLVSRYGDGILLRPKGRGVSSLVWSLPVIAVIAGGALLAAGLRSRARAAPMRASEEDRALVERALLDEERA